MTSGPALTPALVMRDEGGGRRGRASLVLQAGRGRASSAALFSLFSVVTGAMDIDTNPDCGKVLDQEMAYGYSLGLHNIMVAAQATQICMTPVGFTIET